MDILLQKKPFTIGNIALFPVKKHINVTKKMRANIMQKSQLKRGQFCLKEAEIKKIINAAETPRDRIIIELLYYCGLRRSEVVAIQPGDLDLKAGRLRVRGKGGKERLVPVPAEVCAHIRFYLGNSRRPYLFPAKKLRRAPLAAIVVNRVIAAAASRAGVDHPDGRMAGVNPHLLRHSAARRLKASGVPLEAIAAFLGHERIAVTAEIYGLMGADEVLSSVAKVMQ